MRKGEIEMAETNKENKWLTWAMELQSLAQAGLFYGKDQFDIERYERKAEKYVIVFSINSGILGVWSIKYM